MQTGWKLLHIETIIESAQGSSFRASHLVQVGAPGGGCLVVPPAGRRSLLIKPCNSSDAAQHFQHDGVRLFSPMANKCMDVDSHTLRVVQVYACNGGPSQNFTFANSTLFDPILKGGMCIQREVVDPDPAISTTLQAWAKPVATKRSAVALLLINPDALSEHIFEVPLLNLPFEETDGMFGGPITIRDIWARQDLPNIQPNASTITANVGPLDSVFLRLTRGSGKSEVLVV